jgi:hypothetical protein
VTHQLWIDRRPQGYGHGSKGRGGGWPGLRQVALIRTTRWFLDQTPRQPVVENHFYLTSLPPSHKDGSPGALLAIARNHWEIENGLHFVKDASMSEDASRNARASYGMSWVRNLTVFLLRFVKGASTQEKQILINAVPSVATRLIAIKRRPRKLIGER